MPYEQIWEIKQTAHVLGSMFAVLETLRKPQDPSRPSNSYLFLFNKLPMTVGVLVQKYAQTHTHLAPRSRIIVNHVCDVGCTLQRRWSRIRSGCIKLGKDNAAVTIACFIRHRICIQEHASLLVAGLHTLLHACHHSRADVTDMAPAQQHIIYNAWAGVSKEHRCPITL